MLPAVLALLFTGSGFAMPGLPTDLDVDPEIPTPQEVIGFEPGQWHPRHDQIVAYMHALAEASDRVVVEQVGLTHGQRPLLMVTFASPERLDNIDQIRAARRDNAVAGEGPPVVWLGYSVHGNEASGASAALVMAWYLAASRESRVQSWLEEMVIVMEPAINPDGIDRFAHWVNMHRGQNPSADSADREHNETWPSGRTNYYWFDLNRDWLPLVHPESRARMRHYHAWRPHVLTDHHEMGADSTYFFQPGVPERNNPLTPERNFELTAELAEFHGAFLDRAGEPYYTRESFDDYYLGKGSTYPDLTGGIGILFEQGSARGHVQDTDYGERTFAEAVANQVRTSLSTLTGTQARADELIAFQRDFFDSARDQARRDQRAGWLLGDGGDPVRAAAFVELLIGHDLAVHPVESEVEVDGQRYGPGSAWVIPAEQDHYRFLRSIFEPVTDLPMETFYDVSAWPMAMAYDLPLASTTGLPDHGDRLDSVPEIDVSGPPEEALAWLVPWDQHRADAVLAALLADGFRVQAITKETTAITDQGELELVRGSLIIHAGIQPDDLGNVGRRLAELGQQHRVEVLAAERGLSRQGIDLGSPSAPVIEPVSVALLTGRGLRANHAGYIWHWFDTRLQQPVTQLDWSNVSAARLADYTHLVLPDGRYGRMPDRVVDGITDFVDNGGVLLALRGAAAWVEELELGWQLVEDNGNDGDEDANDDEAPERRAYEDHRQDFARELIGGSALNIELDITHPLAFGYSDQGLVVFRRGRHALKAVDNHYAQVAVYADQPLASGFLSEDNQQRLAGTPAISASRHGSGTVVRMADDVLFRGYWRGGEKLFANAVFFSRLIGTTRLPSEQSTGND